MLCARVLFFFLTFVHDVVLYYFVLWPLASLYLLGPSISFTLSGWRLIDVCYDGVASLEEEKKDCCCVDKDDDEHLTAWALIVLYSLGVVQGYVFLYAGIIVPARGTGLPKEVAGDYSLDTQLVSEYLEETVKECTKDPSFARGRNLVTYAVDLLLMEPMSSSTFTSSSSSSSNGSRSCSSKHYLSGLAILGSILQQRDDDDTEEEDTTRRPWLHGQAAMLKHLLTSSASCFGQVIHRLLETLGPGSPYSGAVRARAARVLAEVAGSVRLEEFPGATRCISSSLLCTFEEHCWRPEGYERDGDLPDEYERDWLLDEQECRYILEVVRRRRGRCLTRTLLLLLRRCLLKPFGGDAPPEVTQEKSRRSLVRGYVGLVISGLRVLQALAASEDNCVSFISSTRGGGGGGELSRTMRPLTSDGLHRDHHDEWCMIAEESLKLLTLLMAAPGETGKALRVQIAGDTAGAVAAQLETVLGCPRCQVALKRRAVEVVLGLGLPPPVDTSSSSIVVAPRGSRSTTTTSIFMGILLHISLLPDKHFGGMSGPTHVLKKRSCTRRLAGEKLLAMASAASQQPSAGDDDDDDDGGGGGATATATSMLQAAGVALGNLTSTVVGAEHDASWRIHAAHILEDLCRDYTKDDEYLKEIKKAMCLAMPEVIKQLLGGCGSTRQQAITVTEAKKIVHCQKAPAASTDLEQGAVSGDTIGEETAPSPHHRQQPQDDEQPADEGITELYQALVSLCHGVPNSWIETDKDLASELNSIAAEMGVPFSTFISLRAELKRRYCWEEKNARVRTN